MWDILQDSISRSNNFSSVFTFSCVGSEFAHPIAMTSAPPPPTSADPSSSSRTFTIGTRKSKLAVLQTDLVLAALKEAWPDFSFQIATRETAGDRNTNIALRDFSSKNLWTQELEDLLIAGHVDFIVHSLKGASYNIFVATFRTFNPWLIAGLTSFCNHS